MRTDACKINLIMIRRCFDAGERDFGADEPQTRGVKAGVADGLKPRVFDGFGTGSHSPKIKSCDRDCDKLPNADLSRLGFDSH